LIHRVLDKIVVTTRQHGPGDIIGLPIIRTRKPLKIPGARWFRGELASVPPPQPQSPHKLFARHVRIIFSTLVYETKGKNEKILLVRQIAGNSIHYRNESNRLSTKSNRPCRTLLNEESIFNVSIIDLNPKIKCNQKININRPF